MAGVYFAFSAFIMTAFARVGSASGIAAMTAINDVILKSLFMPLFTGTTLAAPILLGVGAFRRSEPGALAMAVGGGIYVVGMFVVTMLFNVPLNNELVGLGAADPTAHDVWARYLAVWTRWNHAHHRFGDCRCRLHHRPRLFLRLSARFFSARVSKRVRYRRSERAFFLAACRIAGTSAVLEADRPGMAALLNQGSASVCVPDLGVKLGRLDWRLP